jgi:hypothetical protein
LNSQSLTHHVTHRSGWSADIRIAPSLQRQLENPGDYSRRKAQDSVCIAFRETCRRDYPRFSIDRVYWSDLTVVPLSDSPTDTDSAPRYPMNPDGDECDDCAECENGNHQRCRRDCPILSRY